MDIAKALQVLMESPISFFIIFIGTGWVAVGLSPDYGKRSC